MINNFHNLSTHEQVQAVFLRVCRDSRFRMAATDAAYYAGAILGCSPLMVWTELGMDAMEAIAEGTHDACLIAKTEGTL